MPAYGLAKVFLGAKHSLSVRGQLSIQVILIFLLGITAAGGLLNFILNLSTDTLAETEKIISYPEIEPQILSLKCFTTYGYVAVNSEKLEGTILYEIKNSTNLVKKGELDINITDFGTIYFGGLMNQGLTHTVRFFTPKWSITETCNSNYHKDLQFYTPFNEGVGTAVSDKVNYHTGTMYGTFLGAITGSQKVTGYSGSALEFNGSGDYVNLGNDSAFNFGLNDFTVSAWVKHRGNGSRVIVAKLQDSGWPGFTIMVLNANTTRFETSGSFVDSTTVLSPDTWYFVTGVRAGNDLRVYVNGAFENNLTLSSPSDVDGIGNLTIGKYGDFSTPNWYNGTVDEVRLYNRSLNDSEVLSLYQGEDIKTDLLGDWNFDGLSTTVAEDNHMWISGVKDSALYFDGEDDYALVPDSDYLDISTPWTVSFWTKKLGSSFVLISKDGVGADTTGAYNFYFGDEYFLQYEVNNVGGVQTATGTAGPGEWFLMTVTFDNTTNPNTKIYVNGEENVTGNSAVPTILTKDLLFGRRGVGSYFNGVLDEVYIYNSALTSEEIKAIYEGYAN